jgi:hypothetical protein
MGLKPFECLHSLAVRQAQIQHDYFKSIDAAPPDRLVHTSGMNHSKPARTGPLQEFGHQTGVPGIVFDQQRGYRLTEIGVWINRFAVGFRILIGVAA